MLRSPRNRWLPAVVTKVDVFVDDMDRSCRLLTRKLPLLRELSVFSHSSNPLRQPVNFLPSLRPFLESCSSLVRLALGSVKPFSFSALAHLLADMPKLEELDVDVSWVNAPERPPTRMSRSSFPCLRRISCRGPSSGTPVWFYAPFLARHCKHPPEDVASDNSDAKLLALLTTQLLAAHRRDSPELLEYDAGAPRRTV